MDRSRSTRTPARGLRAAVLMMLALAVALVGAVAAVAPAQAKPVPTKPGLNCATAFTPVTPTGAGRKFSYKACVRLPAGPARVQLGGLVKNASGNQARLVYRVGYQKAGTARPVWKAQGTKLFANGSTTVLANLPCPGVGTFQGAFQVRLANGAWSTRHSLSPSFSCRPLR